jgi:hypothetical protein
LAQGLKGKEKRKPNHQKEKANLYLTNLNPDHWPPQLDRPKVSAYLLQVSPQTNREILSNYVYKKLAQELPGAC